MEYVSYKVIEAGLRVQVPKLFYSIMYYGLLMFGETCLLLSTLLFLYYAEH